MEKMLVHFAVLPGFRQVNLKRSSFLDLPPEIRNLVYFFAFNDPTGDSALPVARPWLSSPDHIAKTLDFGPKRSRHMSLLQTCTQVRAEALGYFHTLCHAEINTIKDKATIVKLVPVLWPAMRAVCGWRAHRWFQKLYCVPYLCKKDIRSALDIGSGMLRHVKHLDVYDDILLELLYKDHDPRDLRSRTQWAKGSEATHDQVRQLARSLVSIERITIYRDRKNTRIELEDGYIGCGEIDIDGPDSWFPVLPLEVEEEAQQLFALFPKLQEFRVVHRTSGQRFKRGADDRWYHWYTGAVLPWNPDW